MDRIEIAGPSIDPSAFIAPGTHIHGAVLIGPNAVVMFGTVIRAELDRIEIGAQTNIQDNAVLHADENVPCIVGTRVTVGHGAVVHGAMIRDHCLVGIGARALNRSELGEGAWLASGAVLPEGRAIPPWTLAVGIPAKPVRELTEDEIDRQRRGVADYQRMAAAYRRLFDG